MQTHEWFTGSEPAWVPGRPLRAPGFSRLCAATDSVLPWIGDLSNHRVKDAAIHGPKGAHRITLAHLASLLSADRAAEDPARYVVFASNAEIAAAIGRSLRTVAEHLARLEAEGWCRRFYRSDTNWRVGVDLTPLVVRVAAIERGLAEARHEIRMRRRQGSLALLAAEGRLGDQIDPALWEGVRVRAGEAWAARPVAGESQGEAERRCGTAEAPVRISASPPAEIGAHIRTPEQGRTEGLARVVRKRRRTSARRAPPALARTLGLLASHPRTAAHWRRICMSDGIPNFWPPAAVDSGCSGGGMEALATSLGNPDLGREMGVETAHAATRLLAALVGRLCTGDGRAATLTWRRALGIFGLPMAARMAAVALLDPGRRRSAGCYLGGLVRAGIFCRRSLDAMLAAGEARIARDVAGQSLIDGPPPDGLTESDATARALRAAVEEAARAGPERCREALVVARRARFLGGGGRLVLVFASRAEAVRAVLLLRGLCERICRARGWSLPLYGVRAEACRVDGARGGESSMAVSIT